MPFAAEDLANVTIDLSPQRDWGWREHPILGGQRWHAGIDLPAPTGTPTRTVAGGQVVYTGDVSGYGLTVVVRTATGHLEQFAHLSEIDVALDDVIQPGGMVGKVGSTGQSTGPHLDFVVYIPEVGNNFLNPSEAPYTEYTMDPIEYLRVQQQVNVQPLGHGAPLQATQYTPDPNLSPLENLVAQYNSLTQTVQVGNHHSRPNEVYNNASPQSNGLAALSREAYKVNGQIRNDPAHNYGYEQIANDRGYRIRLAEISNDLGIPAQWLADVIDYETAGSHSAGITNYLGCVGLIQFCPGGGMSDLAQEWGVSVDAASRRLQAMSEAEQLTWVHYYLSRYSNGGSRINTIEDLYALINGGPGALAESVEGRARGYNDGNGGLPDHFRRLGRRAGRRYESSYDRLQSRAGHTHVNPVPGCPECNRMMTAFGEVLPHSDPNV